MKKVTHMVGTNYKNGQLKSEIKDGILVNYFENGKIKARGAIKDEQMCGKWKFFHKSGDLAQIGEFEFDLQHGEFMRYDKGGNITYHALFEKGKLVKKLK